MSRVRRVKGQGPESIIELRNPETRVGRDPSCDIILSSAKASRLHARIRRTDSGYVVVDEGSTGGTFVGGLRVQEHRLVARDILRFAEDEFEFLGTADPAAEVPRTLVEESDTGTASPPLARLRRRSGPGAGVLFTLKDPETRIGRDPSCDLVLESAKASRLHTRIRKSDQGYVVLDEGSTGGTFVNGNRIKEQRLRDQDVLRFADEEYEYLGPSAEQEIPRTVTDNSIAQAVNAARIAHHSAGTVLAAPPQHLLAASPVVPGPAYHPAPRPYYPAPAAAYPVALPAPAVTRSRSGAGWVGLVVGLLVLLVAGVLIVGLGGWYLLGRPTGSTLPGRTVASRTLTPSDSPQTVRASEQVSITIPGGALKGNRTLTVRQLSSLPPVAFKSIRPGAAYDISLGDVREFETPATIELAYDPSAVPAENADQSLVAGAWIESQKLWELIPVKVDKSRGTATLQTRHLCIFCLYYLAQGYRIYETPNFNVVYDPNLNIPMGDRMQGAPEFAQRLAVYLEQARKVYLGDNFRIPATRTWAFVDAGTAESERRGVSGNILFATSYLNGADQVRYEAGHEFFHAVENEYYNVYSMGARNWWMEASADYASNRVWNNDAETRGTFRPTYLNLPIWTMNDTHEYATGLLVARLVAAGANFRGMFEAVANNRSTISTGTAAAAGVLPVAVLNPLENYVYASTGTSLPVHYLDFAGYLLLDAGSPYAPREPLTLSTRRNNLAVNVHRLEDTLSPTAGYTARTWAVTIETRDNRPRPITVEATTPIPGSAQVGVFVLPRNARTAGIRRQGLLSVPNQHLNLQVARGDAVYVIAVNSHLTEDYTLGFRIEDNAVSVAITPDRLQQGEVGKSYSFTAQVDGIPEHVANLKYVWDFGDEEQQDGTVQPARGSTTLKASHRWRAGNFLLKLRVWDANRPELPQLGVGTAQVEVAPDDAGTSNLVIKFGPLPADWADTTAADAPRWASQTGVRHHSKLEVGASCKSKKAEGGGIGLGDFPVAILSAPVPSVEALKKECDGSKLESAIEVRNCLVNSKATATTVSGYPAWRTVIPQNLSCKPPQTCNNINAQGQHVHYLVDVKGTLVTIQAYRGAMSVVPNADMRKTLAQLDADIEQIVRGLQILSK